MIDVKDIEKLAALARIRIPDSQKEELVKEFDAILGYVEQIQTEAGDPRKMSTSRGEELGAVRNVLREDAEPHESGIFTEKILNEAPQREGNYLKVKKIL